MDVPTELSIPRETARWLSLPVLFDCQLMILTRYRLLGQQLGDSRDGEDVQGNVVVPSDHDADTSKVSHVVVREFEQENQPADDGNDKDTSDEWTS